MGLMESKNGSAKECAKRFRCPKWLLRRITVVFNEAPKYRSEEARECGSEKWKARKARKVVNAGNAEREARMSGMIAKLKNIVLNDTPISRNAEARECGSEKWKARKARKVVNAGNAERGGRMSGMRVKQNNVVLNHTPISRNADGCPVDYAGRTDRHRCPK